MVENEIGILFRGINTYALLARYNIHMHSFVSGSSIFLYYGLHSLLGDESCFKRVSLSSITAPSQTWSHLLVDYCD